MIFFSAHGVPLAYVEEAGDPYKAEMEECVDLIMEELEKRQITNAYTLAYQVRFMMSCSILDINKLYNCCSLCSTRWEFLVLMVVTFTE